jgi:hypothetical protein
MRISKVTILVGIASVFVAATNAQKPTVSIGAVTKYTGVITSNDDVKELKSINSYLNSLESQLASEFVKYPDVQYLDRTNTENIFHELHLSSNSAFNPSSGAIRGLLGRLDFLTVIDSSEPSNARLRLIDVETGAVKAVETCKRVTSFFGTPSDAPANCIAPFVTHTRAIVQAKQAEKETRLQHQAAQQQAARRQAAAQQDAQRKQEAAQQQQQVEAQRQQASAQAELDRQLAIIKPDLNNALSRLSTADTFWNNFSKQLAASGIPLRSEIQTALNIANADGARCQRLATQMKPTEAKTCTAELNHHLDTLEAMK